MPPIVRPLARLGSLLPWLLLFVTALGVRALRFGLVFVAGGVRFPHGADELYHLRRIWFTVVHFPASLGFDPYMNHPHGAPPIWPPLFDWTIAAVARALVGPGDQVAVERVAVWAPPLLGALAVLAAAALARRTFSPAAGWVTGVFLALLPAHVFYSALGEVDHHVAVGLFVTGLVAAALWLTASGGMRASVATGAAAAAALLLWPGSLLHVVMLQAGLGVQLLATAEPAAARARARVLAAMHATAAILVLPFCAGHEWEQFGSLSPEVLSNFQPLWLGAGAAAFAVVAALWSWPAAGASRARRLASALALATLGLAGAWWFVPGLSGGVAHAAGWFERDPFLGVVDELQPLFFPDGRFDASLAHDQFSYLIWAYPLALAGLGAEAVRRRREDVLLLLAWSAACCVLTLFQQRFTDLSAAAFALVMGAAFVAALRALRDRLAPRRAPLVAAALGLGVLALSPYACAYRGDLSASLAAERGGRLLFGPGIRQRRVLERVARWLHDETPPTQGYLDPALKPEYGVLSAWGQGHLLRYYGERPMVEDNFGPWGGIQGFEAARAYYASFDEEAAFEIAQRLGARYVVAAPQGSGQSWPRPGSMATRLALARDRGGALAFPGLAAVPLSRHRLVFAADDADLMRAGEPPWAVGVYEIVPGAHVVGSAPGATHVTFEIAVPLPGRPPLRYRGSAKVDASGRYELRLPYPAGQGDMVRAGGRAAPLLVSDDDVREGRSVDGPSFAP